MGGCAAGSLASLSPHTRREQTRLHFFCESQQLPLDFDSNYAISFSPFSHIHTHLRTRPLCINIHDYNILFRPLRLVISHPLSSAPPSPFLAGTRQLERDLCESGARGGPKREKSMPARQPKYNPANSKFAPNSLYIYVYSETFV